MTSFDRSDPPGGPDTPRSHRGPWVAVGALGLALAIIAGAVAVLYDGRPDGAQRGATPSSAGADKPSGPLAKDIKASLKAQAPSKPPARVCGSPSLEGPAAPPVGAVAVKPSDDLEVVTQTNPAGTTFWLEPGRHQLDDGRFSQVRPKSGNRYIGGPGAVFDGRGRNLYAFGGRAEDVRIEYLTIESFGDEGDNNNEGVVNHDAATGWLLSHLVVQQNAGAGIFLGDRNVVRDSCLKDNRQYGFSAYSPDGVRNLVVDHNEITGNNTDDWERRQPGCGCTGGGKFWDTRYAVVTNNYVHDNRGAGIWADTNNAGFLIQNNYISDNDAEGLFYEISYNAAIVANTFVRNGVEKGPTNEGFATGAVYISESGADERVDTDYSSTLEVARNDFVDNWGGVVAWENADRFAGSPANTSTGYGTLVNEEVTLRDCRNHDRIGTEPYTGDCRWKTQNLAVHDNTFSLTPQHLGPECTEENLCGVSGLFSNYGTFPDWSPYKGTVVEEAITFDQHNVWTDNTYVGPWRFMVLEMGNTVSWDEWQGDPYDQDAGSTLSES